MLKVLNAPLIIPWWHLKEGSSLFVPCLEFDTVIKYVMSQAKVFEYQLVHKAGYENGLRGVRFWRVRNGFI